MPAPPTTMAQLRNGIEAAGLPPKRIRLTPDNVPAGPVGALIAGLPGAIMLLEEAAIDAPTGEAAATSLTVAGRATGPWPLPNLDGTVIKDVELEFIFSQPAPGKPIASALTVRRATAASPQSELPMVGAMLANGELRMRPAADAVAPRADVARLVAGAGIDPASASALLAAPLFRSVPISDVELGFRFGSVPRSTVALTARTSGIWSLLDGDRLALRDPRVTVETIRRDRTGRYARDSLSVMLEAEAMIGSNPFDVRIGLSDEELLAIDVMPRDGRPSSLLADLAGLAGGDALRQTVEAGMATLSLDSLSVAGLRLGLDWGARSLRWASVDAELAIGGGTLGARIGLVPAFDIAAGLVAGSDDQPSTIDVGALAERVLGDSIDLPELRIDQLAFAASPGAGTMSLLVGVETSLEWDISGGGGPVLTFNELVLRAAKSPAGANAGLTLNWSIGGFDVTLDGFYQGSGRGWQLSGAARQDEPVGAGTLLRELGSQIGLDVPAPVAEAVSSLRLAALAATVDTGTKAFSFLAEIEAGGAIPIGLKTYDLALRLNLASTADGEGGRRSLAGHFEADLDIGDATFLLSYDFGSSKVIRGSWSSEAGETIRVADIVAAIGLDAVVGVPDGLDLSLNAAGFEYVSDSQSFTLSAASSGFGDAFFTIAKGADGKWGFVFGVEATKGGKLSDLPGIGGAFAGADSLSIEQATIILSSASLPRFSIPNLPPVPAPAAAGQAGRAIAGRPISPLASGMNLQLSSGISLVAMVDLGASSDPVIGNLKTIVGRSKLLLQVTASGSAVSLFAGLGGSVSIPAGGSSRLVLTDPAMRIDIGTVNAFQVSGSLAFSISGTPVRATARLLLSATQAQVAMTLAAEQGALPPPPGIKGLHLEEFGVALGVFFAPPAVDLGVQGRFRIGEERALRPDEFAFVLQIIEEVPNLLYLSFYIDKLDLGQVVTLFTDSTEPDVVASLEIIKASNLSFHWAEMPVVLPDGTTAQPGYGFTAAIDILSFGAHAELEVSSAGLHGMAEMAPINLNGVLQVTGDGKGMYRTYEEEDGVWKEVANNAVVRRTPPAPTRRDAIVAAGGPVIAFNALQSPFVHISCQVSLFDLVRESVDVTIASSGLTFALTYDLAGIERYDLHCTLSAEGFEASADFGFHIDASIGPIRFAGVDMGSIHLSAGFDAAIHVKIDDTSFALDLSGSFEFMGIGLTMPTLTISVPFASLASLPGFAMQQIRDFADDIFEAIVGDVGRWAQMIGQGLITGVTEMANVLKSAFNSAADEAVRLMQAANQSIAVIAAGLDSAYGATADAAAELLRGAGYTADQVASGLRDGYGLAADGVAQAMRGAGYAAQEVAGALTSAYGATADGVAAALRGAGYAAQEVGAALQTGFGYTAEGVAQALRGAGYAAEETANALRAGWGYTAEGAAAALRGAGYAAEETANALKAGWGHTAEGAAVVLRGAGYAADETGRALRQGWDYAEQGVATAMRGAGYALDETGNFLRNSFGMAPDALNSALQGAGYAAGEVASFFQGIGGAFADVGRQIQGGIEEAARQAQRAAEDAAREVQRASEEAARQAQRAAEEVQRAAEEAARQAQRAAEQAARAVQQAAEEAARQAQRIAEEAARAAQRAAEEAARTLDPTGW